MFALVFPTENADAVMSGAVHTLSLGMLSLGVAGIVVTLLFTLKHKRKQVALRA